MAKKNAEVVEEVQAVETLVEAVEEVKPKKSTKKSTKKVEDPVKEIPVETSVVAEEPKVEEAPKKKTTKKKAEPVEEVKIEEPIVVPNVIVEPESVIEEPPVIEEPQVEKTPEEYPVVKYGNGMISFPTHTVEEVKPGPVKDEPKVKTASGAYEAIATTNLYVLKTPGILATKRGSYKVGTKFTILEEDRGWGKVADGKWINLNYVEKV